MAAERILAGFDAVSAEEADDSLGTKQDKREQLAGVFAPYLWQYRQKLHFYTYLCFSVFSIYF
jgi:hypothetical protein